MTAPPDLRYSDPLTGSGSIDGTNVGVTDAVWAAIVGTGTRGGSALTFSGASSGTAFAAADFGMADFDVQVKTYTGLGGGDSLYFRVVDAANWWRIRQRHQRTTTTSYGPWYGTGWVFLDEKSSNGVNWSSIAGYTYSNYIYGIPQNMRWVTGSGTVWWAEFFSQSVTRDTYTSTQNYRYLIVEKCVAGVVTTVNSTSVSEFGRLRVSTFGDRVTWYKPDGLSVQGWVDDATHKTATKHGIGIAGTDSTSYGSNLRDFVLQLPGSLTPPSIVSPADGADVELGATLPIVVASNYGPDNPLTNVDGRWRVQGAGSWTDAPNVLAAPGTWNIDTSGLSAPVQVEVQVKGTDSFANESGYRASVFVWLRTAPSPPVFISPAVDDTVVAANIAVVDFDDATGMQARRVADHEGNPDTETIYEDDLNLTADGDYFRLSGDGDIHPQGLEHIQVRRQTAAGGSLWSVWESLRVEMQLAHPARPDVSFTLEPDSARIVFAITLLEATLDDPAATAMEVIRDGERIAVQGIETVPASIQWIDGKAGPTHDYRFRFISDNGGVVTVK